MFNLYKKKDKVKIPPRPQVGLFHISYERQEQPSPGAEAMAYKSLALPTFPLIGPGTSFTTPLQATARPVVAVQSVPTFGLPTQAGGVRMNALYDPALEGYPEGFSGIDNVPYRRTEVMPIGAAL